VEIQKNFEAGYGYYFSKITGGFLNAAINTKRMTLENFSVEKMQIRIRIELFMYSTGTR
jgi:hypothetical protein